MSDRLIVGAIASALFIGACAVQATPAAAMCNYGIGANNPNCTYGTQGQAHKQGCPNKGACPPGTCANNGARTACNVGNCSASNCHK